MRASCSLKINFCRIIVCLSWGSIKKYNLKTKIHKILKMPCNRHRKTVQYVISLLIIEFTNFFVRNFHTISFPHNGNKFSPPQVSTWKCQEKYWYPQQSDHRHNIFHKFPPVCCFSFNWALKTVGFVFQNKIFYGFYSITLH